MTYLFMQTLLWIILAFILGLIVGWWLRGLREDESHDENASAVVDTTVVASEELVDEVTEPMPTSELLVEDEPEVPVVTEEPLEPQETVNADAPELLIMDPETKDDLKRIKGVGPVIEKTLNELGICNFAQIAELTPENVQWVEDHISFPGRVVREDWINQAKKLDAGEQTEFSKRVDTGNVSYDDE